MLRIHCTERDLLRTRFLAEPSPMTELVNAVMMLRRRDDPLYDPWRAAAWRDFPRAAKPLLDLVFPEAAPDYLDSLSPSFAAGLDEVMAAPHPLENSPFDDIGSSRKPTAWVKQLAQGDKEARWILEEAVKAAYDKVFTPLAARIAATYQDDLASRQLTMLTGGVGAALASVFPDARWNGLVLEVPHRHERDVYPDGYGITLIPSAFWTGRPLVGRCQPVVIVYAARIPLPLIGSPEDADRRLGPLIGRTRAAVLETIVLNPAMTTSALAQRLGISPGRTHEHVSVLRGAGLITSHRYRNTVLHMPTALGTDLNPS